MASEKKQSFENIIFRTSHFPSSVEDLTRLFHFIAVKDFAQTVSATCEIAETDGEHDENTTSTPNTLFFHVRPLKRNGVLPEPWGYYSRSNTPIKESQFIPMREGSCDSTDPHRLVFESTLPGVKARVE